LRDHPGPGDEVSNQLSVRYRQVCLLGFISHQVEQYSSVTDLRAEAIHHAYVAIALYVAQAIASTLWLRRHRFGPLERVWRAFSYR